MAINNNFSFLGLPLGEYILGQQTIVTDMNVKELRWKIYDYILPYTSYNDIRYGPRSCMVIEKFMTKTPRHRKNVSVDLDPRVDSLLWKFRGEASSHIPFLQTCRQIYHECMEIVFTRNTFNFYVDYRCVRYLHEYCRSDSGLPSDLPLDPEIEQPLGLPVIQGASAFELLRKVRVTICLDQYQPNYHPTDRFPPSREIVLKAVRHILQLQEALGDRELADLEICWDVSFEHYCWQRSRRLENMALSGWNWIVEQFIVVLSRFRARTCAIGREIFQHHVADELEAVICGKFDFERKPLLGY